MKYWIFVIGCDLAAANTVEKDPSIETWSDNLKEDRDQEYYDNQLNQGRYDKGVAIICGPLRHAQAPELKNKSIACFDFDSEEALGEFLNILGTTLEKLAAWTRVEWHGIPGKVHIFFITSSTRPFKNFAGARGLEIKSNKQLVFVSPSLHAGKHVTSQPEPYTVYRNPKDNGQIIILNEQDQSRIENLVEIFVTKRTNNKRHYFDRNSDEDTETRNAYVQYLNAEGTVIGIGERHAATVVMGSSMFFRYANEWESMSDDDRFNKLVEWHKKTCKPSLFEEHGRENEVEKIWKDICHRYTGQREKERDERQNEYRSGPNYTESGYPELKDNVFYQIGQKPERFIIAYRQSKQLGEATAKSVNQEVKGQETIVKILIQNKTFLSCIPIKIVRHKSQLTFLDTVPSYTISFVDAAGEHTTFSHKTLSEILSGLKSLGYVLSDGAEGAIGAMLQAFKERKILEDNEDMDYVGFFIDKEHKIIASNLEINTQVNLVALDDALKFVDELKQYYEDRLDLLATSIVWGMSAPAMFMLKTNNYFLKALHFYGFPNASKSNTGKIILAIDGHHDNPDFLLNISRIDTIARLGDVVSHTTFPKLVDELDLNSQEKTWLVNALKSVIESRISRSKFLSNNAATSTGIPALSPLILTSNPPPPFHDSGYMRRIIERNFCKSESHNERDEVAVRFKEFLRMNLGRMKALGDFRNWWIMNNQGKILDEARPPPLDLGFEILVDAYNAAGRTIPDWFSLRLPENQLEESIWDNATIVKYAFEQYIDEKINQALPIWRLELGKDESLHIPGDISDRLVHLTKSNLLPGVKWSRNYEIIITKGILQELYRRGVTKDQLPDLRALADYMNADYRKSHGIKAVAVNMSQLTRYFDKVEGPSKAEETKDN